ncbi:MAG: hypothetical protein J4473_05705 [Candidatus Aenigmarchaeota archaeon]|nr:hypothetical protein [Candidatus Aenigmarchaeota archaeon]
MERVRMLTQQGMSDKDVIRQLKSEGYSYDEIEKGMLNAVKDGVDQTSLPMMQQQPQIRRPQPVTNLPTWDEVYEQPQSQEEQEQFAFTEEEPTSDISPELAIEELVEGVVNEKWEKLETRLDNTEKNLHRLMVMTKKISEKEPTGSVTETGHSEDIQSLYAKVEDLEARVGGLEKAFKQFLPTLTRNIESLSAMIHEMKRERASV